jgi:FkbM family methyltransferase
MSQKSLKQTIHGTGILLTAIWTKRHLLRELRAEAIPFIKDRISPSDICLDVGAHAGAYAVPLSSIVRDGHVYAFETFPYYAGVLKRTIRILGRRNITVVNKAVTDRNGPVQIAWKHPDGRWFTQTTHVARLGEEIVEPLVVDGITLDSFLDSLPSRGARKIGFVKIDVEGMELLVLRGAARLIQEERPIFYLELYRRYCLTYGYEPADVFSLFERNRYRSFVIGNQTEMAPVEASTYTGEGDVFFIPAERC